MAWRILLAHELQTHPEECMLAQELHAQPAECTVECMDVEHSIAEDSMERGFSLVLRGVVQVAQLQSEPWLNARPDERPDERPVVQMPHMHADECREDDEEDDSIERGCNLAPTRLHELQVHPTRWLTELTPLCEQLPQAQLLECPPD